MPARPLTQLELAFAHNNGIELLTDNELIERMEKGDAHIIADTWFQEFTNVHRRLFSSRSFNHDDEKPGIIWHSRGKIVAPVLSTLVKQLYDEGGFAKRPSRRQLATYLADAYTGLSNVHPFEYGEELALRTFFALIGKTKAMTDDQGKKLDIDFTRLSPEDFKTLSLPQEKNREAIDRVFEKLLDPDHNPPSQSLRFHERWDSLPKSETEIAQKHFLSHTLGHAKCLVTLNGGLVPLDAVEGDIIQHINRGGHPADFTVPREKIIDYLIKDGREKADHIDGIPVTDEAVPLFPLNVDLLTGLDVTTQLPSVKDYCKAHNTHILRLPEYIKTHELPDNLKSRLERAARRVEKTRELVWQSVDKAFEGKSPVQNDSKPKIFMTMGGTGSGKSNLATIASQCTNGNVVEASLDEARTNFSAYDLYSAVGRDLPDKEKTSPNGKPVRTGHHFGDYIALETGAGFIREGIVDRAKGYQGNYQLVAAPEQKKEQVFHLLYDGSGVPYKGKYEDLIRKLSRTGFETYILVADAPITTAYERADRRLKGADGRAVPPKVIVDKHRGLPQSMRDAVRDEHVHHFAIIDTTRDGKGEHYTLAHRVTLPLDKVKELEAARKNISVENPKALFHALEKEGLLPAPDQLEHAPEGWQERAEFVIVAHDHHDRKSKLLVITDADRMAAISRKGALNPNASGKKDLHTFRQAFEVVSGDLIRS